MASEARTLFFACLALTVSALATASGGSSPDGSVRQALRQENVESRKLVAYGGTEEGALCQRDAMIVFDASGSMGATDYALGSPRIARAKQSMARVLPEVAPFRSLGLIVYGEGAYNDCTSIKLYHRPAPNAAGPILATLAGIQPRGRTPLTESVRLAAETLDYRTREAVIVLLTDGEETCGGDPCRAAARLKAESRHLLVHVVGYRDDERPYFKARCMADETGGKYFSVSTEDELVDALRKTLGCPLLTERRKTPLPFSQAWLRAECPLPGRVVQGQPIHPGWR